MESRKAILTTGDTDTSDTSLPRLYERDVDVLLAEEFVFNRQLIRFLAESLKIHSPADVRHCRLSVEDAMGETDLLIELEIGPETGMILIENKIDANFQIRQAERYRERAEKLLAIRSCSRAFTVLIAPKDYLLCAGPQGEMFDARLSYQQVAELMRSDGGERGTYRANLLLQAVEQARQVYKLVAAEDVTAFWQRVYAIAASEFPALKMKAPGAKGAYSNWLTFKGDLPSGITIDWKVSRGVVDLTFWEGEAFPPGLLEAAINAGIAGAQMNARGAKAKALTIILPSRSGNFIEMDDDHIRCALKAANDLLAFYSPRLQAFRN